MTHERIAAEGLDSARGSLTLGIEPDGSSLPRQDSHEKADRAQPQKGRDEAAHEPDQSSR